MSYEVDSKDPKTIGAGHGKGGMLKQIEPVYNDVKDRFGKTWFMGAYNNRNIAKTNTKSMHAYGRAFDIGGSKETMYKISRYLQKIAGVQYVIYNREVSFKGGPWHKYTGANAHTDHVHVDFLPSFRYTSTTSSGSEAAQPPTIKAGSFGDWVEWLQKLLGGLTIDGVFGPKTEAAVKEFQKNRGLQQDGIVGMKTWKAISEGKGLFFYK